MDDPKMGRPPLVPTDDERKQVEAMAGYGVPFASIAALIQGGIDEDTLNKHFCTELRQGKAKAQAKVGQTLWQRATSGEDTTAAIWYSKTQMGWKDTSRVELAGDPNSPVNVIHKIERAIVRSNNQDR